MIKRSRGESFDGLPKFLVLLRWLNYYYPVLPECLNVWWGPQYHKHNTIFVYRKTGLSQPCVRTVGNPYYGLPKFLLLLLWITIYCLAECLQFCSASLRGKIQNRAKCGPLKAYAIETKYFSSPHVPYTFQRPCPTIYRLSWCSVHVVTRNIIRPILHPLTE